MSAPYPVTPLTRDGSRHNPLLLAGLGAASISASGVLVRLADTGVATVAFYRCLLAVPVLAVFGVIEQRRLGRRELAARRNAVLAGLSLGVDLVLWNHAIAEVGAGIATVLGNLQVVFVAIAAWALYRERPGRRFLIALPVVMIGVVLVSGFVGGAAGHGHPLAGVAYGVGTSVAYAGFLLILRRTSARTPHIAGPLAEATASAAAASLVLGLLFGGFSWHLSWQSFGWLLLLAMSCQTLGWLLITSSLPRLPSAISSLTLLLQPAGSMLLAAAVLGEEPSVIQIGGAALVCCGVLAATIGGRHPAAADGGDDGLAQATLYDGLKQNERKEEADDLVNLGSVSRCRERGLVRLASRIRTGPIPTGECFDFRTVQSGHPFHHRAQ